MGIARRKIGKPSYTLTRQAFWVSFVLAWTVIIALMIGALRGHGDAVGFAGIAVPSMVTLIAAILGIHRFAGAQDMRTVAETQMEDVGGQ